MKTTRTFNHDPKRRYRVDPMGSNFLFPLDWPLRPLPNRGAFSLLFGMLFQALRKSICDMCFSSSQRGNKSGRAGRMKAHAAARVCIIIPIHDVTSPSPPEPPLC